MSSRPLLREISLFQSLSDEEVEKISQRCAWRTYPAGHCVVAFKDRGRDVFFVISGAVRVTLYSLDGKEVSYRDIGAGEIFGEMAAIDGEMRSANIVVLQDARIASMSPDVFWSVLNQHPGIAANLLRHLSTMIRTYSERIFEFSALAVRNRIHAELLRLARPKTEPDNSARIHPAPTHAEIASRISTHREAVTREISRLKRDGLVQSQGGALRILDVERLERMVEEVI